MSGLVPAEPPNKTNLDDGLVPAERNQALAVAEAERAAAEIRANTKLLVMAWAHIMEACLKIRNAFPDHAAFSDFVLSRLGGVISPADAWNQANLWEAALRTGNRSLFDLTRRSPREALMFMREFTAAKAEDSLQLTPGELDEYEQEIAELAALPRKARRARVRELGGEVQAARQDRNPDDVTRIAQLEATNKALAEKQAATDEPKTSAQQRKAALADVRDKANALCDTWLEASRLGADTYLEPERNHLLSSLDMCNGLVQRDFSIALTRANDKAYHRDLEEREERNP